jgi:hypothetical protein
MFSNILRNMVSRSVLAALGVAAAVCFNCQAQSTAAPSQPGTSPSQSGQAGQSAPAPSQPAAPLQLRDLPPDPHTPTPAEQQQQRQQAAMNAAVRLATLEAHWGPEMDTPGLSIALTEVGRTKMPEGGTQITYRITGSGFSPEERLMLVRWPLNGEAHPVMSGIGFDAKGVAVCGAQAQTGAVGAGTKGSSGPGSEPGSATAEGTSAPATPNAGGTAAANAVPSCADTMKPQQPVEIEATVAEGEAVRVAVMGNDRKHGAAATVIPFPIAGEDKGCKVEVILGMRDAALVLIEGTGLPGSAPMQVNLITGGNTRILHAKTSADGRLIIPVLPAASGQDSGETTVRFGGNRPAPSLKASGAPPAPDAGCAPEVSFQFGKGTYKAE